MPPRAVTAIKVAVFLLLLIPAGLLFWQGWQSYRGTGDGLGVNPVEAVTHRTGDWTLYSVLLTLAVTPVRRLTGQQWVIRLRRMLGLFAFFYGSLHFLTYCGDQVFMQDEALNVKAVLKDIAKRPYITVGTLAYLLMIPLALTSTAAMIRRLGPALAVAASAGVRHVDPGNPALGLAGQSGSAQAADVRCGAVLAARDPARAVAA